MKGTRLGGCTRGFWETTLGAVMAVPRRRSLRTVVPGGEGHGLWGKQETSGCSGVWFIPGSLEK